MSVFGGFWYVFSTFGLWMWNVEKYEPGKLRERILFTHCVVAQFILIKILKYFNSNFLMASLKFDTNSSADFFSVFVKIEYSEYCGVSSSFHNFLFRCKFLLVQPWRCDRKGDGTFFFFILFYLFELILLFLC